MENRDSVVRYVKNANLFDIMQKTHSNIGHGGRIEMHYELKKTYANITVDIIMLFLQLCVVCQKNVLTSVGHGS